MAGANATRRDFLKAGAAFGGLVAASRLPALADDPSLFPGRGKFERLSIVSRHINAGATKPFSLLHISDTHLTAAYPHESEWTRNKAQQRARTFGGRQEEALRDSLAWAKGHVDFVVHTGDLIDFQSDANLDLVKKYYGSAAGTIAGSLGNHEFYHGQPRTEETEEHKETSRAKLSAAYPFDISLASTVVNSVNFVTIDDVYGTVTEEQVERFKAEVAKGLPVILCMHCPFSTALIWKASAKYWNARNFKGVPDLAKWRESSKDAVTRDFKEYLKREKALKAILAGHLHMSVEDRFSPTAMEYLVGGNYLFHGAEITVS